MKNLASSLALSVLAGALSAPALASDCSDLSSAIELSSVCPPAQQPGVKPLPNCALEDNKIYKVSASSGTQEIPLLPIIIPKKSAVCIVNDSLTAPVELYLSSVLVMGTLQIGTPTDPIKSANPVKIVMTGTQSVANAPQPLCNESANPKSDCSAIAYTTLNTPNARDITVVDSGKLLMYGAKGLTPVGGSGSDYIHSIDYANGKVDGVSLGSGSSDASDINSQPYFNTLAGSNSWTYLNKPAGPAYFNAGLHVQSPIDKSNYPNTTLGGITITDSDLPYLMSLSRNIASGTENDWQPGDWVSVSTTTFIPHETEIVQICAIYSIDNPDSETSGDIAKTSVLVLAGSPSFKSQCNSVTGDTPLKHYHFGSLAPTAGYFTKDTANYNGKYSAKKGQAKSFYDGGDRNFGIDERAEVALLSRNITLTSTAGIASTAPIPNLDDQYFGGHIAVMDMHESDNPTATVALVGVEIEKFGQPLVGRYPVHFHRLNAESNVADPNLLLVQDTSVHHSFNKCFVTHDTMGVNFYNNSCVRTIGQGFYLEDGYNIAGNEFVRNLVAGTMAAALNYDKSDKHVKTASGTVTGKNTYWDGDYLATDSYNYDPAKIPDTSDSGANTGNSIDSFEPSGFWITSFGGRYSNTDYPNVFVNNSVAGCQMRGAAYWVINQKVQKFSDRGNLQQLSEKPALYPVFSGNRGHACYDGFIAGNGSMVQAETPAFIGPQPSPVPVGKSVDVNENIPFVIFDNLNFTQIQHKAFWYRGAFIGVNNSRFAALKQGMTLLGGGGPEGNLLGFWGLVHNSVFAGVTNNNVGRFSDCEGYYEKYGKDPASLAKTDALQLDNNNEIVKCTPVDMNAVSGSSANVPNTVAIYAGVNADFNFQGYTFYDGPARMEDNRFVNFRADVTDPALYDNSTDTYSSSEKRYLVTLVDAHRMMNYQFAGQLTNSKPGGNKHYGAMGDAAFSWLRGNAQSVPPTQYALGNLWDNVNFKHQIFTEVANLSNGLKDGDKQTVEIDRDGTLSGYEVCASNTSDKTQCGAELNHYPISLNNLNIFASKSTVDEPHSQGRNNVVSSALMSPNKYATVNVEVGTTTGIHNLIVSRDMQAYGESATTEYSGRGGLTYMYESMAINNMGYTYSAENMNDQTEFMFSFSDAPVDTTFINRVGFQIGKGATSIKLTKVARQWNSMQNYLQPTPYWTGYGLTNTGTTCPSVKGSPTAFSTCESNGTALKEFGSFADLNQQFFAVMQNNYNLAKTKASDVTEKYYYDACSGVLYFNMVQFAQTKAPKKPVTPPYGTCDSADYSKTSKAVVDYLKFSNPDSISSMLDVGCYAESGTPETSELLTCPTQGCAVYTVSFVAGGDTDKEKACTSSATPTILDGGTAAPSMGAVRISSGETEIPATGSDGVITYGSPYTLYDVSSGNALAMTKASITVQGMPDGNVTRSYNYPAGATVPTSPDTPLLPMPPAPSTQNSNTYNIGDTPTGITILPYPASGPTPPPVSTTWTFVTGNIASAGQNATLTASSGKSFDETSPTKQTVTSLSIKPTNSGNVANFTYAGTTATLTLADGKTCTITFGSKTVSKGSESGCGQVKASQTTITVDPKPTS